MKCEQPDFKAVSIPRPLKIRFTYDYNVKPEVKTVRVELRATGINADKVEPVFLTVTQKAAPRIEKGTRRGDSLALIAIARGLNCEMNWELSRSMMTWNNVLTEDVVFKDRNGEDSTDLRVTGVDFFMINTKTTLPFEVTYLTECKTFIASGNANAYLKNIPLGPEITTLPKLRSLALPGYGIHSLPEELTGMETLEELAMNSNTFMEIPMDIITRIPNLTYLNFSANRRWDGAFDLSNEKRDSIGLRGELPVELFKMKKLKHLALTYNYFEGTIPEIPQEEVAQFETLKINLNRLTGRIPEWILQHPNLGCWDPFIFIFTQEGKDVKGKVCMFTNEPSTSSIKPCPLDEIKKTTAKVMQSWKYQEAELLSLYGNWGY